MNQPQPNLPHQDDNNQQVFYAYPGHGVSEHEIDLGELLGKFLGQWKLMGLLIIIGTLFSILIALSLPGIYKVYSTLSLPSTVDISPFRVNGFEVGNDKEIFRRYYNQIRSEENFSSFLQDNDYLEKLYPNSQASPDRLFGAFIDNYSVNIDEPAPQGKGDIVSHPERITLELLHTDEALISKILSSYVAHTGEELIKRINTEQLALVDAQIKQLEAKIRVLRISAKEDRLAEISRLTELNKEQVSSLDGQIQAVLKKATADTRDRIVQIKEARAVAESLGIVYPTDLKEIKKNESQEEKLQTLIQVNGQENLPLFLMGTRYLDSLIISIQNRKNESAFVSEINTLRMAKDLLEKDTRLATLKARVSDDAHIEELPAIMSKIEGLKALSLDFSNAGVYTLERAPLISEKTVEPNRKLIVVLGLILSCIVSILVVFVVTSIKKEKK